MKWLILILLIACNGGKGSGAQRTPAVETSPPTPPATRPQPLPPVSTRNCVPGGLPEEHVRAEDYLSFPNFGYRGVGRCRGHAILTQKLLLLLRFDPRQGTLWNCDTDPVACRQDIRAVLDAVEDNKIIVVPGFSTLAEFSAHPVVEAIMRARIISYGSRYSANRLPLPGDESRSVLVFKEALRRVTLNQIPYLALNGAEVGNHGVLGYAESEKDGKQVLCVRDPNIVPAQGREECDNYFFQDGDTVRYVRYERPEDTVIIELTDDEDRRTSEYRRTLCK
jgi:hypothetical protein